MPSYRTAAVASDELSCLTQQMRGVIQGMRRLGRPPLHALPVAQARAAYEAGAGVLEPPPAPLAQVQDLHIPARDGAALPARLYVPSARDGQPLLLFLHGGGFTIGSIATHDGLCRTLAHQAGCRVLSLGYRLAPEHRFPTAFEDCWDALQWLAAHGGTLGADATRLAVGGDSAGGTLAAACAIAARDARLALRLQLLIYPGTGAHQDTESHRRFGPADLVIGSAAIDWFFNHYIAPGAAREDWRFAPLLAPDLDGVAPAWVALAECDPLVDEGIAYADRLRLAGVSVDLDIYRGVTHEFIKMGRAVPEARQFQRDAARALRGAFGLD